ncbi:MAG: sulfite exporter TauE/SafE family protein [Spongiibacteraceae bacterium]
MLDTVSYSSAFLLGLLGSPHCVGMCGGIASLLGLSTDTTAVESRFTQFSRQLGFQLGRIFCYSTLGLVAGSASGLFTDNILILGDIFRVLASVLLILIAISVAGWHNAIKKIEYIGAALWRKVQPLTRPLLPADRLYKALSLGVLWGFLPCGLIYSALAWASLSGDGYHAALLMACFGLGTMPAVMTIGGLSGGAKAVLKQPLPRKILAVLLIAVALLPLQHVIGKYTNSADAHAHHGHQMATPKNKDYDGS